MSQFFQIYFIDLNLAHLNLTLLTLAIFQVHVGDKFDETRDEEMFDLKRMSMGSKGLKSVVGEDDDDDSKGVDGGVEMPEVESDSSDEEEPLPMKKKVVAFKRTDDEDDEISPLTDKKNLDYMGEKVANETVDSDEEEIPDDMEHDSDVDVDEDDGADDDDGDDSDVDDADDSNPLIQSLTGDKTKEERLKRKTNVWFAKDVFNDVDDDDDDEFEITRVQEARKRKRMKTTVTKEEERKLGSDGEGKTGEEEEEEENDDDESDSDDSDSDSEDEKIKGKIRAEETEKRRHQKDGDFEVVPAGTTSGAKAGGNVNKNPTKAQMLDPEGLAIASYMIQSRKNRREIEESGFNRWVKNDKHLPDWFVKDEKMHWRNHAPVQITKDMVEEFKKRQMEINARPIKKVAEAKARKKKRALKQLEKVGVIYWNGFVWMLLFVLIAFFGKL